MVYGIGYQCHIPDQFTPGCPEVEINKINR